MSANEIRQAVALLQLGTKEADDKLGNLILELLRRIEGLEQHVERMELQHR
jgi:hypothetical protein